MAPPTPKIFTLRSTSQMRSIFLSPRGSTQNVPEIEILSVSLLVVILYVHFLVFGSNEPSSRYPIESPMSFLTTAGASVFGSMRTRRRRTPDGSSVSSSSSYWKPSTSRKSRSLYSRSKKIFDQ